MLALLFILLTSSADDSNPSEGDLLALEKHIPTLVASNAEYQAHISRVEKHASLGHFFSAFPQYSGQPLLSPIYLQSILHDLEEQEIDLLKSSQDISCSTCSKDITSKITELQNQNTETQLKYIHLQRSYILQILASIDLYPNVNDDYLTTYKNDWTKYFQYLEETLKAQERKDKEKNKENESKEENEFQIIQVQLRHSVQHLSHLDRLEKEIINAFSVKNLESLHTWLSQYLLENEPVSENRNPIDERRFFEFANLYTKIFPKGKLYEKSLLFVEEYNKGIEEQKKAYLDTIRSLEKYTLSERKEELQKIRLQLMTEISGKNWSQQFFTEIIELLQQEEQKTDNAIQKEGELSQEVLQQEVLVAQKALEEALLQRQQDQEKVESDIQDNIIEIRESIQKLRRVSEETRESVQNRLNTYDELIATTRTELQFQLTQSSLSTKRQSKIDELYTNIDNQVTEVRSDIASLEEEFSTPTLDISIDPNIDTTTYATALEKLEQARQDYVNAKQDAQASNQQEIFGIFERLETLKQLRRELSKYTSDDIKFTARADFWFELTAELREQPIHTRFWLKRVSVKIQSLPMKLLQLDFLYQSLIRFTQFIFLGLLWLGLRQYGLSIIKKGIQLTRRDFSIFDWMDNDTGTEQYTQSTSYIIDSLFAFGLYLWIYDSFPTITFLILICLGYLLWRWRIFLEANNWIDQKLFKTVFYFICLLYSYFFLIYICVVVMSADRLGELITFFAYIGSIPLMLWALLTWSDSSKKPAQIWIEEHKMFQWLEKQLSHEFLKRILWSCIGLGIIIYQGIIYVSLIFIESTGWFGTSFSSKDNVYQTTTKSIERASEVFADPNALFQIKDEITKINEIIVKWSQNSTSGILGIIGDHGSGKTTLLNEISHKDYNKTILVPSQRMCEVNTLHRWLRTELEIGEEEDIISSILQKPSQIIIIDKLHFFFLRNLKGYEGLYEISKIMQHTSHRHCWIVGIHLHAWNFLHSQAIPFHTDVFHSVVKIGEVSIKNCMLWSAKCAETHNVKIDFSTIHSKYKTEYFWDQVQKSYWRLLIDSSIKNPSAVQQLWMRSLEYSEEQNTFFVHYFTTRNQSEVQSLHITEQFILSTILIHGNMTAQEQSETLNIDLATIVHYCNNLENAGILSRNNNTFFITYDWYPTITLFLQQKRMLVAS